MQRYEIIIYWSNEDGGSCRRSARTARGVRHMETQRSLHCKT